MSLATKSCDAWKQAAEKAPKFVKEWLCSQEGDDADVWAWCSMSSDLAQSRHAQCADECPLLGSKRTVINRCSPISIYEYTAK